MPKVIRASIALLAGLLIFVGLPLLVWGLGDLSGFFQDPVRLTYVALTIVMQTITVIVMPSAGENRFSGGESVSRQRFGVVAMQIICLAVVVIAPYSDRHNSGILADSTIIRVCGMVLYVIGSVVMNWAEAALGEQFTVQVAVRKDHRLITTGIYRYLRHPRYLGILLAMFGISLVFRSWYSLVAVGLLAIVLIWRINDEESLMHRHFASEWEDYSRKSWRLIPFVY